MPVEHEEKLLISVFVNFHNPHRDFGSNRLFHDNLKKDEVYSAKRSKAGVG